MGITFPARSAEDERFVAGALRRQGSPVFLESVQEERGNGDFPLFGSHYVRDDIRTDSYVSTELFVLLPNDLHSLTFRGRHRKTSSRVRAHLNAHDCLDVSRL